MANHLPEEKNYTLWVRLCQARDTMARARGRELRKYGITPEQAAVLVVIKAITATGGIVTASEISRWLLRQPHAVSKILTRMESMDLVTRNMHSDRHRGINIALTEKGKQAYRQSLKRETINEIISCLSEEECLQLDSLLGKIRDKAIQNLHEVKKAPFP